MKVSKNYLLILFTIIFLYACESNNNVGGGSSTSPATLYVANTNDVVICTINESDGNLQNCHNNPIHVAEILESQLNVYGISMAGTHAYLTDVSINLKNSDNLGNFIKCSVIGSGDLTDCQVSQSDFAADLNSPYGSTIYNGFIYIANSNHDSNFGSIITCPLDPINESNDLDDCRIENHSDFYTAPWSITINNGYSYVPDAQLNTVAKCSAESDGVLDNCSNIAESELFNFDGGSFTTTANGYAYFTNNAGIGGFPHESTVTSCTIESDESGNLTNCNNSYLPESAPKGIAIYNNRAYIVNDFNHLLICQVFESNGTLQQCEQANITGATLNLPAQVTIVAPK